VHCTSGDVDETLRVSFASRRSGAPADSSEIYNFRDTRTLRVLGTGVNRCPRPCNHPESAALGAVRSYTLPTDAKQSGTSESRKSEWNRVRQEPKLPNRLRLRDRSNGTVAVPAPRRCANLQPPNSARAVLWEAPAVRSRRMSQLWVRNGFGQWLQGRNMGDIDPVLGWPNTSPSRSRKQSQGGRNRGT
jgi:hypothetical protein